MDVNLRKERENQNVKFNPHKITNVLDDGCGNSQKTERRREIERAVRKDRVFSNENNANLNRVERHANALAKHLRVMELAEKLKVDMSDCTLPDFVSLISATADDMPSLLHWGMFVPSCKTLLSDEQQNYWLPRCHDCRVVGCYAQTELGHGSNVRALETEARFEADERGRGWWVLNTPTLTSTKFWPGSLGKTANTAMVIARLIDGKGVDRGVHNFIVPIRDYLTHLPLPGVTVGDIGSKIGYNTMDNGFLKLENVRVPLDNMAMRFVKVDSNGKYSKREGVGGDATQKIAYLTMMQVRAQIVGMAGQNLAIATTIAVRYSAVRVQGYHAKGKKEIQILDYVQQQHRLFGHLASSYCFWIGGKAILRRLKETERKLVEGSGKVRKGDMGDLHASLSALKAYCSGEAADGIEDCRKACGGHGYLVASGFPELLTTYLQNPTVEGDNHMLPQQVCKVLLKLLKSAVGGEEGAVERDWQGCDCFYLVDEVREGGEEGGVEGVGGLLRLLKARAGRLLVRLGERLEQLVREEGKDTAGAWNLCQVEIARLSKAHAVVLLMKHFINGLKLFEAAERKMMEVLCRLWALQIIERDAGDFVGVIGEDMVDRVRDDIVHILGEVRKSAVVLVDAFDFTDFRLKSALGRFDGNVYPEIMKAAMKDMMNKQQVWEPVVVKGHVAVRGSKL
ncbi:hypothetical protein TrCOL_g11217 [Triparma columacea]|uniref:Acyl-coenzyme A oxidase n=1 Tax=Triparma columacea TaxID=722753 RepID=A0A9W7LEB0_9STRA|nr:hypothetical protein TrCOL_g11217 [Triparma columacea]